MPVSSITREKRVPANQHPGPMDQWLNEGLQIRSNTFQARPSFKAHHMCIHASYSLTKIQMPPYLQTFKLQTFLHTYTPATIMKLIDILFTTLFMQV